MGRPGPLWDSFGIAVQPGCTNLGLGTLLHSRTNADDQVHIGCSQVPAKTEYNWGMGSVAHAVILGEHTANINRVYGSLYTDSKHLCLRAHRSDVLQDDDPGSGQRSRADARRDIIHNEED